MKAWQKAIKYTAMAFAIFLCVSIIYGILGVFTSVPALFGGNAIGKMKTYGITGDISKLDIEIGAAAFTIKTGGEFRVESNLKNLTVEEKDGVLKISEKKKFWYTYNGAARLELYIPADTVFDEIDFNSGAGRVDIDALTADEIDFDLGAGEVTVNNLIAFSKAKINGGAGRITIDGGSLHNLDFDMGVGEMNLTSKLDGNCTLELGVGSTKINLIGTSDDYRIDVSKGLGEIDINGEKASDDVIYGSGDSNLKVDGGIGEIKIAFVSE